MEIRAGGGRRIKVIIKAIVVCFVIAQILLMITNNAFANVRIEAEDIEPLQESTGDWPVHSYSADSGGKDRINFYYNDQKGTFVFYINTSGDTLIFGMRGNTCTSDRVVFMVDDVEKLIVNTRAQSGWNLLEYQVNISPGLHKITINNTGAGNNPGTDYCVFDYIKLTDGGVPPSAPTNLTATAIGPTQVQLAWDPNTEPDLAGYIIYRNDVEIARVGNDTTSYTDNDVQPNTSYTYRISAYCTSGAESDMSDPVTVTIPGIPKPVLTASVDNRNINLSWTGTADEFLVMVNGQQVAETTENQYTYTAEPGSYELQVVAVVGTEQFASDPVSVTVSRIATLGAAKMAGDLIKNMGLVIAPLGGLLALALALKASPTLIAIAKASVLRRFFW